MNAKALAEHRAKLKAAGICTSCHSNSARPRYVTCQPCQDRINTSRANRVDRYRQEGRCSQCGTKRSKDEIHWNPNVFCGFCTAKRNEQHRMSRSLADPDEVSL